MSGAYFASIVTKLVVNPQGMDAGLAEGERKAKGHADKMQALFAGPSFFGGLDRALGGATQKLIQFGTTPAGIAAGVASATVGAARMIDGFVDAQNEKVLELEQSAKRLGISRQDRAAFDVLLGPEKGASYAHSLTKFNKLIGEAQSGSNEAIGTLKLLGMSVESVAKMTDIQRIEQLAKALNATTSAGERTKLTIATLGKKGMEQSEALSMIGVMGLDEARKFGVASGYAGTNDAVLAGIEERLRSARSAAAWQGMKNRLAGILEPISNMVDTAQDKLTDNMPGTFTALKFIFTGRADIGGKSGDRKQAKELMQAMEKWATAQDLAEKLGAIDNLMAGASRANATFGMSAKDVAIFDFTAKLKDANILQTADGMKRLADYTKLLSENAEKIDVARFEKLGDPVSALLKDFAQAQGLFAAGKIGGSAFAGAFGQFEKGLGLSPLNPVRSTLANASDVNTFAGQAALQAMMNKEGGGLKTAEDRAQAIIDKLEKVASEEKETTRETRKVWEILDKRMPELSKATL